MTAGRYGAVNNLPDGYSLYEQSFDDDGLNDHGLETNDSAKVLKAWGLTLACVGVGAACTLLSLPLPPWWTWWGWGVIAGVVFGGGRLMDRGFELTEERRG